MRLMQLHFKSTRGAGLIMLALSLLLTACGYHLRGDATMPFKTLYITATNPSSPLISELRSRLKDNHVKLVDKADLAEVILDISLDQTDKQILTLASSGLVSAFQLRYHVSLRAYDKQQRVWLPADELRLSRDYTYNDTQILAKASEEALLYQSMRNDMVQQILRRLSHTKPGVLP
ncbi:MAG: LPS assembly lipoprotein LptE [Gallionella sp.]